MQSWSAELTSSLSTPCCKGHVKIAADAWECQTCHANFPIHDGIPWFYAKPAVTYSDWQNRFGYLLAVLNSEAESIKVELTQENLRKSTEKRLRQYLQSKVEQIKELQKILSPLQLKAPGPVDYHIALKNKLPENQTLMSYYPNVFRDWSWETDENKLCLEALATVITEPEKLGTMAVLGAGACRLPADVHIQFKPEATIAVDINPFLFYVAKRVLDGRNVTAYEFPIAPLDAASFSVKQKCQYDGPKLPNFFFLFADAMNPSFKDGSLDTILTPWLIDVVPQDFPSFARQVNRPLKTGGKWINFGSVSFNSSKQGQCYSRDEIAEIVAQSGFRVTTIKAVDIPYMQSPHSAQKRFENVFCFEAEKVSEVGTVADFNYLPDWLTDETKGVPKLEKFAQLISVNQTFNVVVGLIDGNRSVTQIAEQVHERFGLSLAQTKELVKRLLTNIFEGSLRGRQF
ncbi:MAG: hypothetical protein AB7T49_15315 [Oligoflexales bacterium]